MQRYGDYVWACARRAAKGSVQGALNWGPIIGAGVLGAIYTYRGRTLSFADDWTGVVLSAVAYSAAAWLVIFTFRLLFVCPYQIWREQLSRLRELERRLSVKVVLRFEPREPFRKPIELREGPRNRWPGISIRVQAETTRATVYECQPLVTRVERETADGFVQIAPWEPLKLPWALEREDTEFEPTILAPGVPKFFGVVQSAYQSSSFRIRTQRVSHSHPPYFSEPGKYRLKVMVTGKDADTAELWLEIEWNGKWEDIAAREWRPAA